MATLADPAAKRDAWTDGGLRSWRVRPPVDPSGGGGERPRQSFQGRITAAILLTAVTVLFVGCVLFMVEQHRQERDAFQGSAVRLARLVAASTADALSQGDKAATARRLAPFEVLSAVQSARVDDAAGAVVARMTSLQPVSPHDLITREPVFAGARRVGEVTLRVKAPVIGLMLPRYLSMGGALFFATTGLALFLGRWLAARITDPVARLSESMGEVGRSSDFSRRVEPFANDELGRLTETFNHLLATLHANDLTLRRTMGELVLAHDAAQAANVQKSQFLANMSHEIRTPLNGVLAMAQIMAHGEMEAGQRERLRIIYESGEALLGVLNDILDVSKIEAGKFELEIVEFDVAESLRAVHAGFSALADRKGLDFDLSIMPGALGVRLGDSARLRQILNNLVSNALKFTDSGRVGVVVSGLGDDGVDGLAIAVADSGIGIAPEKMPLLFQKFSQVDASNTRRFGGTGLGLAICYELAQLMGGRVWVNSVIGEGSTFNVELPLARVREAKAEPPVEIAGPCEPTLEPAGAAGPPKQDEATLRVLAAEDNPTNQLVLATIMQIFGFELVMVGNGRDAVTTWERESFDAILMDIQMPILDGLAATRAIRVAEATTGRPRTPIIALSANALTHQVQEYLASGMDAHVAKPIELSKLQAALDAVLLDEAATQAA